MTSNPDQTRPGRRLKRRTEPHRVEIGGLDFEIEPFGPFEKDMAEEVAKGWARKLVEDLEFSARLNLGRKVLAALLEEDGLTLSIGLGRLLYAVALGSIIVRAVPGLQDVDGAPITGKPSPGQLSLLFQENAGPPYHRSFAALFEEKTDTLRLLEDAEGKPSAGGPAASGDPEARSAGGA